MTGYIIVGIVHVDSETPRDIWYYKGEAYDGEACDGYYADEFTKDIDSAHVFESEDTYGLSTFNDGSYRGFEDIMCLDGKGVFDLTKSNITLKVVKVTRETKFVDTDLEEIVREPIE